MNRQQRTTRREEGIWLCDKALGLSLSCRGQSSELNAYCPTPVEFTNHEKIQILDEKWLGLLYVVPTLQIRKNRSASLRASISDLGRSQVSSPALFLSQEPGGVGAPPGFLCFQSTGLARCDGRVPTRSVEGSSPSSSTN